MATTWRVLNTKLARVSGRNCLVTHAWYSVGMLLDVRVGAWEEVAANRGH